MQKRPKPALSTDHRLIGVIQAVWGKSRNNIRRQQVRDPAGDGMDVGSEFSGGDHPVAEDVSKVLMWYSLRASLEPTTLSAIE